jgi:diguanylate cyclase (GGDEF)-like protein
VRRNGVLGAPEFDRASLDHLVTISREGKIADVNEATIKVMGCRVRMPGLAEWIDKETKRFELHGSQSKTLESSMKGRFARFLSSEGRKLAIPLACIALFVLGGMFLCQFLLGRMLREGAQATSNEWVSMQLVGNPDILTLLSGATPLVRTRQLLDEASQVGDIYRFRIWDAPGHIAFKSERMTSAGAPIDGKRVAKAFLSGSMINEVHAGSPPHDTRFFVQSFVPVKQNGATIGVFEIYLDQSEEEVVYKNSLLLTEIIIGTLVLLVGAIPGYRLYRQMLQLRDARAKTLFLTEHDSLTGIPNRHRLGELAKGALALNRRSKRQVAALIIDMDRFKGINDNFGHATGDEVLKAVANRLRLSLREEDSVARFGGDEFVVLQVGLYQPNGAKSLADRLIKDLSEPFKIGGSRFNCGASIGVAISPGDAEDFDTLVACADAALYKAKTDGRSSVRFFEPGMDTKIRERHQIEIDIRRALETDSFQLAYQPIHSFGDGKLLGFEALLRWPEGWSAKSPADFIPVAEESGLIKQLGQWALETACKTAANWTNPLKVAVNLSPVQFRGGDIVSIVKEALGTSGLNPERLELEVTESLWIQDQDSAFDQLRRLRRLGVSIALDDFGTGYSSLACLWKFPFDTVKIDQSFVRDMETEPKAAAIVNTVVALGRTLDLTITAEGVETAAQARVLRDAGCDRAQGFLFGHPLPAASANALANSECIVAYSGVAS